MEENNLTKGWAKAKLLLGITLAWNIAEFFVAVYAGDAVDSAALIGFGLDSGIESFAALFALIAFSGLKVGSENYERNERRVQIAVGASFMILSAWIVYEAVMKFIGADGAETSPIGIALASLSLVVMPILGRTKLRNARAIGSRALAAEAKETIACAWLSASLLIGLAANAAFDIYWIDSATALALVPWLIREGWEGLSGEECESCAAEAGPAEPQNGSSGCSDKSSDCGCGG